MIAHITYDGNARPEGKQAQIGSAFPMKRDQHGSERPGPVAGLPKTLTITSHDVREGLASKPIHLSYSRCGHPYAVRQSGPFPSSATWLIAVWFGCVVLSAGAWITVARKILASVPVAEDLSAQCRGDRSRVDRNQVSATCLL